MTIRRTIMIAFAAMSVLLIAVALFGLFISNKTITYFVGGDKHYRGIVTVATEASSYAKRAESHLMLYLTLHDKKDREKFFARCRSLQEVMAFLDTVVKLPEGRLILEQKKPKVEELVSIGQALLEEYDREMQEKGKFDFIRHQDMIRSLGDAASEIRRYGVDLAKFETNFLNRQEAITAATEASSYAKRAEGHLMLYLTLHNEADKAAFFERHHSLVEQIGLLEERGYDPEIDWMVREAKRKTAELLSVGTELIAVHDSSREKPGGFSLEGNGTAVRRVNEVASAIREFGIKMAEINLEAEARPHENAARDTRYLQQGVFVVILVSLGVVLVLAYLIDERISSPLKALAHAAQSIGRGDLETRIDIQARDEIGSLAGAFNAMREELRKSRDSLIASKEYMDNVVGSMIDALLVLDTQGSIRKMNPSACTLLGATEREMEGEDLTALCAEELFSSQIEGLKRGAAEFSGETVFRAKDGREIPVIASCSSLRDGSGSVQGIVCIVHDISGRKRLEAELIKAKKLESVGLMAGGLAHDFNNLLTGIMNCISLAKESVSPSEKAHEALVMAEKASMQARDLTRQLLSFAKTGSTATRAVWIGELLRESVSLLLTRSDIRFHLDLPEDLWQVQIDEGQVKRVLHNLLINAQEAMPGGGTITVRAENTTVWAKDGLPLEEGRYVRIEVEDEGTGIAEENLPRVFDPYFTTKRLATQKGMGLGLAISYTLIRKHKGHIAVRSEAGRGSVFTFYLPATHLPVETGAG